MFKIPLFPNTFKSQFFIRKKKFSKSHETIYPFLTICMNGINWERVISQTCPISVKKRMGELTLRVNLLRKKAGKSRMKMSGYLPHEMGTHRVCGVHVHMIKYLLCKSNQGINNYGGDHAAGLPPEYSSETA